MGAGLHYGGPGMTAYRLYSKGSPDRFELTLAHGNERHESYDLFQTQNLISPFVSAQRTQFSIASSIRFIQAGRQWVREHAQEFDVFHGLQGFDLTVLPALEAQRNGLPAVVKLAAHQSDLAVKSGWRSILRRPQKRRKIIAKLAGAIAISNDIRDELLSYGIPDQKIAQIPNGVDTEQFFPAADDSQRIAIRERLGLPNQPTIVFSGTLVRRKQPHLLIEALIALIRKGIDAQLVMVGPETDPQYVGQMKQQVRTAEIERHVIWAGFTRDVAPFYRAADIFALPSKNEGMPNALLEAMASGLPCVATDISGSRDLVNDGQTGLLVQPTAVSLTNALDQLLNGGEASRTLGRNAMTMISNKFSSQVVLNQHEQLFRDILSGN